MSELYPCQQAIGGDIMCPVKENQSTICVGSGKLHRADAVFSRYVGVRSSVCDIEAGVRPLERGKGKRG